MTEVWRPDRTVQIVAGTPPGGGLDRVARSLTKAIAEARLLEVPVEVVNIPGDGARRAWISFVDKHPGDGHVVGISSPNLTSDFLVGIASFEHTRYTPLATLLAEYIAFTVRVDSPLQSGTDLLGWLGDRSRKLTAALSTALGNPNHVALAKLARRAAGDANVPKIRVFDSALDAVADVVAGHADVCAVTAASVLAELQAGRVRLLALSAPARLSGPFAAVPTWQEQGADCVVAAWRGVTGPAGMAPAQVTFWQHVLRQAVEQAAWREDLWRLSWSPMYQDGPSLQAYLDRERAELIGVLGELGLLKAPGTAAELGAIDNEQP